MWNERYVKHNWKKDWFKVYLGCHLKEVANHQIPIQTSFKLLELRIKHW
jgi:hypothetical protein